jgi:hypothetical protein
VSLIRRWPRSVAILGNLPGALLLAAAILNDLPRGRFDPGGYDGMLFWPALALIGLLAIVGLLFLARLAWLPLAISEFVLAGSLIALAIITIVAESDRRGSGGLEGTLPWMVGGFSLLAAAFVAGALGVLVDRSRARSHHVVRAA